MIVVVGLAIAGCSAASPAIDDADGPASEPESGAGLVDLLSVDDLAAEFNARNGSPRLILLVSPT